MPLTQELKDAALAAAKATVDALDAWPDDAPEKVSALGYAADAQHEIAVAEVPPPEPLYVDDPLEICDAKLGTFPGGLTGRYLYRGWLPWKNKGGDWVDANGVPQGNVPYGSTAVATGGAILPIDVTSLVAWGGPVQMALTAKATSASAPMIAVASRESATPPTLLVDYADGSSETLLVLADAWANTSTEYEQGAQPYYSITAAAGAVYLRFAAPRGAVRRAHLNLTPVKVYQGGTIHVYRFDYQGDRSTTGYDFRVASLGSPFIETESFEDVPEYLRRQIYGGWPEKSLWLDPYQQKAAVNVEGGRALQVTFDPRVNGALSASVLFPGYQEVTEAAWEFDMRFMPDMYAGLTDGFKCFAGARSLTKPDDAYVAAICGLPPGRIGTLLAGNGGAKAHGNDGWSTRFDIMKPPPAPHPLAGHFPPHQYVYWPEQSDYYGDVKPWNLAGRTPVADEWHRYSMRLRCNDATSSGYMKNAELWGYLDGQLAMHWDNFHLRTTDQPLIALAPYNVPGATLRIGSIWLNTYHGGLAYPRARCSFQVRNFRAVVVTP